MRLPALQFQPYQSLLLFFCFAPLIYLHTCSRPKASQQTRNDLCLFVVRWSKKKAQAHMWSTRTSPHFIFIFSFPYSFTCPQAASLYSLFFISAFYFFHFTSHVDFTTSWLRKSLVPQKKDTTCATTRHMASCGWWRGDVGTSTNHNSPCGKLWHMLCLFLWH